MTSHIWLMEKYNWFDGRIYNIYHDQCLCAPIRDTSKICHIRIFFKCSLSPHYLQPWLEDQKEFGITEWVLEDPGRTKSILGWLNCIQIWCSRKKKLWTTGCIPPLAVPHPHKIVSFLKARSHRFHGELVVRFIELLKFNLVLHRSKVTWSKVPIFCHHFI